MRAIYTFLDEFGCIGCQVSHHRRLSALHVMTKAHFVHSTNQRQREFSKGWMKTQIDIQEVLCEDSNLLMISEIATVTFWVLRVSQY